MTEERDAQVSPEAGESLGARLRQLRRGRFTQRELAAKVDLDYTYLSKIENGAETPSEAAVRRLAEVLEADAEDLLARNRQRMPVSQTSSAAGQRDIDALTLQSSAGFRFGKLLLERFE